METQFSDVEHIHIGVMGKWTASVSHSEISMRSICRLINFHSLDPVYILQIISALWQADQLTRHDLISSWLLWRWCIFCGFWDFCKINKFNLGVYLFKHCYSLDNRQPPPCATLY